MTDKTKNITTLHDLLFYNTSRFSCMEATLKNYLPMWINKAGSFQLKVVLQKYNEFVTAHIDMLNYFFKKEKIESISCVSPIMEAFVYEIDTQLSYCTDIEIADACLLSGIQQINHYKISLYCTAAAFANTLENEEEAVLFRTAEINEEQIDDMLKQLAAFEINLKARAPVAISL